MLNLYNQQIAIPADTLRMMYDLMVAHIANGHDASLEESLLSLLQHYVLSQDDMATLLE